MSELPQNPAPPKTRRRRWLIVAFVFVLVLSLGTWWSWPQVDPRFVGRWSGSTRSIPPSFETFDLHADGTGTNTSKYWEDIDYTIMATSAPRPLSWWVKGDIIYFKLASQTPGRIGRLWHSFVQSITGRGGFRVVQFDGKQMALRQLSQEDPESTLKLQREK